MKKWMGIAVAALIAVGWNTGAMAAQQKIRVHGQIESLGHNQVHLKSYGGRAIDLRLNEHTKFVSVIASSLSNIKHGDFVGIGATGPKSKLAALEVVVFPNSMRGAGEGHYSWTLPAVVAKADEHEATGHSTSGPPIHGTMTNGTVARASSVSKAAPPVHGTMTNGTVSGNSAKTSGKEFTISYNGGKKVKILVKPSVPVVRLVPAHRAILVRGAKVFAIATKSKAGKSLNADLVAVGKNGLMPPM